jgi:hypothetical protein
MAGNKNLLNKPTKVSRIGIPPPTLSTKIFILFTNSANTSVTFAIASLLRKVSYNSF